MAQNISNTFKKAEVKPCSPKQVEEYFKKIKVHKTYTELNPSAKRLVETAQGLSMYGELLRNKSDSESDIEFQNLGTLLLAYVKRILLKDLDSIQYENFWNALEEIAYHMVLNGRFDISKEELEKFFSCSNFIEKYNISKVDDIINNEEIKKLFAKDSNGDFEFTHQNFRDMYCALDFNKKLNNIDNIRSNFVTNNDEILELCGNLLEKDDTIQNLINKLKLTEESNRHSDNPTDYSFKLFVLIKIFAFKNENNIYKLNLENLNLSNVSLSKYTLYNKKSSYNENNELEFTISPIQLKGATVSEYTFESNGLKRGASTICKYTKNNTEYIVAFCSDNLLIYNAETAEWKSKSYHFKDNTKKFGWINCACHIEEEQKIILGTDNGHITFFSYEDEPYINTDPDQYLKYNATYKNRKTEKLCCIESIVQFKVEDSNQIILASNSAGEIFVINSDNVIKNTTDNEILEIRKKFRLNYDEDDFSVCKLTVNDNYCFYSWGNIIFRSELSKVLKNDSFEEWKILNQPCIFDIYCTNKYLFVNTGKEILVFSINDTNLIDTYSYSLTNNDRTRHDNLDRFTKISKFENFSDKIIIGTSAEDQDCNTIPSYILLTVASKSNQSGNDIYRIIPDHINGIGQSMTTFSAVTFTKKSSNNETHTFIATTSNDRAVQILSVDIEDLSATKHHGTYDGIHHIEAITSTELLLSQYDGSVSHWLKNDNEWRCMDVYPIHKDWVWKSKYYVDSNNEPNFFSCSYDGTIKRTNMLTYETDTLIEDDDKLIDLALIIQNDQLVYIYAVTEDKIIIYDYKNKIRKPDILFKDKVELCKQYTGNANYAIKSISSGIEEYSGKVLIAVNFYANKEKDLVNMAKIYSLAIGDESSISLITNQNWKYIKIDYITTQNNYYIIIGKKEVKSNSKPKTNEFIDIYDNQLVQSQPLSNIKSLADLNERRIICITLKDKNIFIGCLDGSIFALENNFNEKYPDNLCPNFITHANLIAIFNIDIKGVTWLDESMKDNFKGYFKNL